MMTMPAQVVRHNQSANRYETDVNGVLAVAEYRLDGALIVFTHTFVPPELRGHGIAEALIRTALQDAKVQGLRVKAECSYVAAFIRRHVRGKFKDLAQVSLRPCTASSRDT